MTTTPKALSPSDGAVTRPLRETRAEPEQPLTGGLGKDGLRNADRGFYILSLKWSAGDFITWWRPDNAGYTQDLRRAGVYSAEAVAASPDYYDDGKETLAVPVASAERWADHPVYVHHGANSLRALRRSRNYARSLARLALSRAKGGEVGNG